MCCPVGDFAYHNYVSSLDIISALRTYKVTLTSMVDSNGKRSPVIFSSRNLIASKPLKPALVA
jgi:hypothetical protein